MSTDSPSNITSDQVKELMGAAGQADEKPMVIFVPVNDRYSFRAPKVKKYPLKFYSTKGVKLCSCRGNTHKSRNHRKGKTT